MCTLISSFELQNVFFRSENLMITSLAQESSLVLVISTRKSTLDRLMRNYFLVKYEICCAL